MYSNDKYGKINIEKAIYNYKQAIRLSYSRSSVMLAKLYESIGDKENSIRLYTYFLLNFDESCEEDCLILLFDSINYLFANKEYCNKCE